MNAVNDASILAGCRFSPGSPSDHILIPICEEFILPFKVVSGKAPDTTENPSCG
jgi:hypothetical protein